MKSFIRSKILVVFFVLLCTKVFSQDFNLFLQHIEEVRLDGTTQRSTSDSISKITFTTMVNGIKLDWDHLIKVKDVEVVDGQGNPLRMVKDMFYKNEYSDSKKIDFPVEAPTRQTTRINTFKGRLLYFTPTEENKGKVIIRDFLGNKKNLFKDIDQEIELTLVKDHELIDIQKEFQKQVDEEVEKRKKEVGEISKDEQREIEYTRRLFDEMLGLTDNGWAYTLTFRSNKKINEAYFSFEIFNAEGRPISTGYSSVGDLYQYHLTDAPAEGCYIQVIREVDAAVQELKFEFNDVVLP